MVRAGSSGGWVLADSWTYSTGVAGVNFTGLGRFSAIRILGRGITLAASGYRVVRVSKDNGSVFLSEATSYQSVASAGTVNDSAAMYPQFTGSASARTFVAEISPFGVSGARKIFRASGTVDYIVQDTDALNAVRVFGQQDDFSTANNFTAGSIEVWGQVG